MDGDDREVLLGSGIGRAKRIRRLAARFVSGDLDCPSAEAALAVMYARTEVHLPVLGWCGFDPTLAEETSLKHIPVVVRYHPRGVMPNSGMFTSASADYVEMTAPVKVERLGDDPETHVA